MRAISFSSVIHSWQLLLLALTSVVLSVASGWTTWLGMQNFTGESVLSLLITFGVQGVMLVLSWIVGTRLSHYAPAAPARPSWFATDALVMLDRLLKSVATIALCLLLLALYLTYAGDQVSGITRLMRDYLPSGLLFALFAGCALAILIIRYGAAALDALINLTHFAFKNILPVSMLCGCLLTSVFFSFDALFSTILPADERQRIADLRSRSEVAAIVNEINDVARTKRRQAAAKVLDSRPWLDYRKGLAQLTDGIRQTPEIEEKRKAARRREWLEVRDQSQRTIGILRQQLITTSATKKRLEDRLAANDAQEKSIAAEISGIRSRIFAVERKIVATTAEADAEARGLGPSATAGRGPQFRRIMREVGRLRAERENLKLQQSKFDDQRTGLQKAAARLGMQIAQAQADLDRTRLQIEQSEQDAGRFAATNSDTSATAMSAQFIAKLGQARQRFESDPTPASLAALEATCRQASTFASGFVETAASSGTASCNTAALQPVAARTFALEQGIGALSQRCTAKSVGLAERSFSGRVAFARDCLNWAQLLPNEAQSIIARINGLERERDDKAHRFVVTTNAFFDGNKLAYLALVIASAIDMLVLASGFIGATAIRSPLAGRSFNPAQSPSQREAIIIAALLPDIAGNARATLATTIPAAVTGYQLDQRWTHEIALDEIADHQLCESARKLVSACAAIGAARPHPDRAGVHLITSEIIEFLANQSQQATLTGTELTRLKRTISQAFRTDVAGKAGVVLNYVIPSVRHPEYSSGIETDTIERGDEDTLRTCLNVASAFGLIGQPEPPSASDTVLVKSEFVFALLDLASADRPPGRPAADSQVTATVELAAETAPLPQHVAPVPVPKHAAPVPVSQHGAPRPAMLARRDVVEPEVRWPPSTMTADVRDADAPAAAEPANGGTGTAPADHGGSPSAAGAEPAAPEPSGEAQLAAEQGASSPPQTGNRQSEQEAATTTPPEPEREPESTHAPARRPAKRRPRVIITNDIFNFD